MTVSNGSSNDRSVSAPSQARLALDDFIDALHHSWFWLTLGWNDILQRYRGSLLGPFWLTLTTAAFIGGLGPLYARLFKQDMAEYLPYLAIGFTSWNFINGTITDSCNTFIAAGDTMKQMRLSRFTLLFQVVWRNIIIFLHNLPIYAIVLIWFGPPLSFNLLTVIPGFALVVLNLTWIGLIVAILCARFRDIAPIISSALQISFFLTPIMWHYKNQNVSAFLVDLNPFAAFIELIRAPLLGYSVTEGMLLMAIGCAVVGWTLASLLLVRCRRQIVYWV